MRFRTELALLIDDQMREGAFDIGGMHVHVADALLSYLLDIAVQRHRRGAGILTMRETVRGLAICPREEMAM